MIIVVNFGIEILVGLGFKFAIER